MQTFEIRSSEMLDFFRRWHFFYCVSFTNPEIQKNTHKACLNTDLPSLRIPLEEFGTDWVNLNKREGQGFPRAGRAAPRDVNPKEHPCKPEENHILPDSFTHIYILFLTGFFEISVLAFLKCMDGSVLAFLKCMDGSVLAFLKCTDGSVLSHLRFPSIFSH